MKNLTMPMDTQVRTAIADKPEIYCNIGIDRIEPVNREEDDLPKIKGDLRHLGRCQKINLFYLNGLGTKTRHDRQLIRHPDERLPLIIADLTHAPLVGSLDLGEYNEKMGLVCSALFYDLIEMMDMLDEKQHPDLLDLLYEYLPPSDALFYFMPFQANDYGTSEFNTCCMFREVMWSELIDDDDDDDDAEQMDLSDDEIWETDDMDIMAEDANTGLDDQIMRLPGPVEDKIYAAVWPCAQVVFSNLTILYRNLRMVAMATFQEHPGGIPIENSAISHLKLPTVGEMTDGLIEVLLHTLAIPYVSKN